MRKQHDFFPAGGCIDSAACAALMRAGFLVMAFSVVSASARSTSSANSRAVYSARQYRLEV